MISANSRIQVLDEMSLLGRARKHQYAAFIRDEGVLCVWSDNVKTVVAEAEKLEDSLLDYIWNEGTKRKKGVADDMVDVENVDVSERKTQWRARPVMMYEAFLVGFSVILILFLTALGYSKRRNKRPFTERLLLTLHVKQEH
jgi:hypothetical protein